MAVGRSLHGDRLMFCDPDWLDTIRKGTKLMLWGIVVGIVGGISESAMRESALPPLLAALPSLAAGVFGAYAVFLLTAQEPRITLTEKRLTLRKAVRYCAITEVTTQLCEAALESAQQTDWTELLGITLLLAAGLASIVTSFGRYFYLRGFALRIPDERLARSTSIVMFGTIICVGFALVVGFLAALTVPGLLALACLPGAGILVFGIWSLILLVRYHRELRHIAKMARTPDVAAAAAVGLPSPLPTGTITRPDDALR